MTVWLSLMFYSEHVETKKITVKLLKIIADLLLPEFLSTFLYYLNFEVPEGFK